MAASGPSAIGHGRPLDGAASDLIAYETVMRGIRVVGILVILAFAPVFHLVAAWLLPVVLAPLVAVTLLQGRWLRTPLDTARLRRVAGLALVADSVAVYGAGTVFAADAQWAGFLFYPLLALEASVVVGGRWAIVSTALSLAVYLGQILLRLDLGFVADPRVVLVVVSWFLLQGGFVTAIGWLGERFRTDLRLLLEVTGALANQRLETDTIELLDRRMQVAVGGRVRSVALRTPDGAYEIVRWRTAERRHIPRAGLQTALGDVEELEVRFAGGEAISFAVEPGGALLAGLGLPAWTRLLTLVPIHVEGVWFGLLPVLWPTRRSPGRQQLSLLHGLAGQVGLAFAQGQLRRIREEASRDPLTGLLNRRAIGEALSAVIERADRTGGSAAVLFCDLDGFKRVNDRRGHEAGDRVLRDVAQALRTAARRDDLVGRYGGDELAVVAPDVGPVEALALATRIRLAVRAATASEGVDVTIGVASYPDDGRTADALLASADDAMYLGKSQGSGNVVRANGASAVALGAAG